MHEIHEQLTEGPFLMWMEKVGVFLSFSAIFDRKMQKLLLFFVHLVGFSRSFSAIFDRKVQKLPPFSVHLNKK